MKNRDVDVAIIGGGTAGLNARRSALQHTDSVVLIEGGVWGTTCARLGCMPSKLLIAAAESAHNLEKAPGFGVYPGEKRIEAKEVMNRVLRERDRFVGFVCESVDNIPQEQKIEGKAKFLDDNTLQIDDNLQIRAKRIVIANGSRPFIPSFLRKFGKKVITNKDLFYMEDLPKKVAVFGCGVIGLELAQALHRLGVEIRVFGNSGRIQPITDPVLRDYTESAFNEEYFLAPKNPILSMKETAGGVTIRYRGREEGEEESFTADLLFAATGRQPNVDTLALENTTLALDKNGVPLVTDDHTMQTTLPTIFIAGDVSNQAALLHEAADQGRIAGNNAGSYPEITKGLRRTHLSIVFCDPQIAIVGENYKNLMKRYEEDGFAIGEVSFERQGRARCMLKNKGILRAYGEKRTGLFLGAEMLAPDAEHLGHLLAWAHQQQLCVNEMLDLPFYHPVVEEGVRTALQDLAKNV